MLEARSNLHVSHQYRRYITANGKTLHIAAWAKEVGIAGSIISYRLNTGWTPEEALGFEARVRSENKKWGMLLEHDGQIKRIDEWAEDIGIHSTTIYNRLQKGFTVEEALTMKKGERKEDLAIKRMREEFRAKLRINK